MGELRQGPFSYLILDARYEKVREGGVVRNRAVLVALGVAGSGGRQVLGVGLAEGRATRAGTGSWSL